jgi:hypothetical protein
MSQALTPNLQRGQRIKGRVVEVQLGNHLLVSFQGKLVRVINNTERNFKVDDILDLQVQSLQPLEFKIYQRSVSFDRMI